MEVFFTRIQTVEATSVAGSDQITINRFTVNWKMNDNCVKCEVDSVKVGKTTCEIGGEHSDIPIQSKRSAGKNQ